MMSFPHVLNSPSAKSFSCAVTDVDDLVCAMNDDTHAAPPDTPTRRDKFSPPSKKLPVANCVPLPDFGMYRHGAVTAPLFTIAHVGSPAPVVPQSAFVVSNSSCSGLLGDQAGSVRRWSGSPALPPTHIRTITSGTEPPVVKSLITWMSPTVAIVPFGATTPAVCSPLNVPELVPTSPTGCTKNQNATVESPLVAIRSIPKYT